MRIDNANNGSQPPSYSCSCQGKALLVALTVLAYIVAIVGTLFLTKAVPNNVLNNPQILVGVGVPLAFILTGACIYFFRKSENGEKSAQNTAESTTTATSQTEKTAQPQNTSASTSQTKKVKEPLRFVDVELHYKGKCPDIQIDLYGTLDDLKKLITKITKVENPVIVVNGEILDGNGTLKQLQVFPTSYIEVLEATPKMVFIEKNHHETLAFVLQPGEAVWQLAKRIENRFFMPMDTIVLTIKDVDEWLDDHTSVESITGRLQMCVIPSREYFTLKYDGEENSLQYSPNEPVGWLKKRIRSLTGLSPEQQELNLPPDVTDETLIFALGWKSGAMITVTRKSK